MVPKQAFSSGANISLSIHEKKKIKNRGGAVGGTRKCFFDRVTILFHQSRRSFRRHKLFLTCVLVGKFS